MYQDYWTVHHYLYIDSTGAEYRLNVNNNGVWSSQEGIYVYYDTNSLPAPRLYFTNGTTWAFISQSGGLEQDAGTRYPGLMEDTNGNQIYITYDTGAGLSGGNSSARITQITDLRGSFNFAYDGSHHLSTITPTMASAQSYSFTIASGQPLNDPFLQHYYGTTALLQRVTQRLGTTNLATSFAYDQQGSGELIQMNTPYGGHLRWVYGQFTFLGNRTQREVNWRYLSAAAGAPETLVQLSGDPSDASRSFHSWGATTDYTMWAQKAWWFQADNTQSTYGLVTTYESRPKYCPACAGTHHEDYAWALNGSNNLYISSVTTTEDTYNPTSVQKKTTQTLDAYGNLTQMQVFDYGNPPALARTYTNTYSNNVTYTAQYIYNRLLTSTVTDGAKTTTLAQITYDGQSYPCPGGLLTDPSGSTMTLHDNNNYGTNWLWRAMPSMVITPSSTVCNSYDVGGNVTTSIVNGVTTTSSTNNTSYYAAPTAISTNSLTTSMSWNSVLELSSQSGANAGDTASFTYDQTNARPMTSTSPAGAVTTYTYADS